MSMSDRPHTPQSPHRTMIDSLRAHFTARFGDAQQMRAAMAPGRVNLMGDHTDYNDGLVLPMTVDRGVYVGIRERTDGEARLYSVHYDELLEYGPASCPSPEPGHWSSYVVGVIEELRRQGLIRSGFEAVIDGNLAAGAGLSSSAALEVATVTALQGLFGFRLTPVGAVTLCQQVEHRYAGVLCGIMDQFASRLGRQGRALLLDCRSLEYEHIPVELGDARIVIADSRVERSLSGSDYNARREECAQALNILRSVDEGLHSLRDLSLEVLDAFSDRLPPPLRRRCRHVITENQRVRDAASALSSGRLDAFGQIMYASHASLRDDYAVSCPELDLLVELAHTTAGVFGARMTGAGFGGCTVTLVNSDSVTAFIETLGKGYVERFDRRPGVHVLDRNLEAGPIGTDAA